jgi:hypothetical protein
MSVVGGRTEVARVMFLGGTSDERAIKISAKRNERLPKPLVLIDKRRYL